MQLNRKALEFSAFVLLGVPGFMLCGFKHICVCGHMIHGNYRPWHSFSDLFWIICFVASGVLIRHADINSWIIKWCFLAQLSVVTLSRLLFSSFGGAFFFFAEIPILVFLVVVAIWNVVRVLRSTQRNEIIA
jgi:hypothetical protein